MKGRVRRYGLFILLGLPLVFALGLGLVDLQQVQARKETLARAEQARAILRRPMADISQLEATLTRVKGEIQQAEGLFSLEGSDPLVAALLDRAREHRLTLTSVAARVPLRREEARATTIPVSLRLSGEIPDLLAFLASLDYPNLEVQGATIAQEKEGSLSITLDFLIHTLSQEQG